MPDAPAYAIDPILLTGTGKVYFASDFHLGASDEEQAKERERTVVRWLDHVAHDAQAIFLLGDTFDFWFEYRHVVPRGAVRFLGKLAELADRGIQVYLFTGNHDLWLFDYFPSELGIPVFREPQSFTINAQRFHVGHGDGLGPGDYQYKMFKRLFTAKACQRLFAALHPAWGIGLARRWSAYSRRKNLLRDESFRTKEEEWIYQYCWSVQQQQHHDYYVFGHRHLVLDIPVGASSRYINTGAWFEQGHFARYDGQEFTLTPFEQ
ncbi:MAG: UDP-2,3-diacylglucosamine diphosphatase [Tunicatimonas sp.]